MRPREAKWCVQGHTARNWWNKPHRTGLVRTSLEVWEQGIGRTGQEGNNWIPTKCTMPPTKICHLSLMMALKIGLIIPILQMRNWSSERERTRRTTQFWLVIQSEWRKLISLGVLSSQSWILSPEWQPILCSFPLQGGRSVGMSLTAEDLKEQSWAGIPFVWHLWEGEFPPLWFSGNLDVWLVLPACLSDCSFGLGVPAKHLTLFRLNCT